MGAIADTAAAIAARIALVPDAGVVFDYQPMPGNDWAAFVSSFTATVGTDTVVRAWTVQYVGESRHEKSIAMGNAKQRRDMRFVVRAHVGWDNPTSEAEFRTLVEAVADSIDAERSIGPCYDHDPVDIEMPGNGAGLVLGDTLVHYAELTVVCQYEQTLATT